VRVGLISQVVVVLALSLSVTPGVAAPLGRGPGAPPPPRYGVIQEAARVRGRAVPTRPPQRPVLPFLPVDSSAFQADKERTRAMRVQAGAGPAALAPRAAAPEPAAAVEQVIARFPVMNHDRQAESYPQYYGISPPDTQLAAGPTLLIEAVNSTLSAWTRDGTFISSRDFAAFFPVPSNQFFTDPRILYDPLSQRWFVSGLSVTAGLDDSLVYVAASTGAAPDIQDPASWHVFALPATRAGIVRDQPKLGVSSDKVVISWNDFNSQKQFVGSETWVLQKSDLLTGGTVEYAFFNPDPYRFNLVPAQALSPASTAYLVYNNSMVFNYGSLGIVWLTGTPSAKNVAWNEVDPAITPTSMPPDGAQPGNGPGIATNDDRTLSAVWQYGLLWTGTNTACMPPGDAVIRSCLRLIQILTVGAAPRITQSFDVGQAGMDLYYPAVTMDAAGNAYVSFTLSSASLYPTAATLVQRAGVANVVSGVIPFQNGTGIYNLTACAGGENRWGDYSAAVPDPLDPSSVWVTAEYSATTATSGSVCALNWGTATARVTLPPLPNRVYLPLVANQ